MDTNSAPSLLTKEISDLSLNEVLLSSLIVVVIVLAVVISFGIKTYLHLLRFSKIKVEDAVAEANFQPNAKAARTVLAHGATVREMPSMPGSLRNSEPAMSKFENGS